MKVRQILPMVLILTVISLVTSWASVSRAADPASESPALGMEGTVPKSTTLLGDNASLQVGYKIWYAQWQTWTTLTSRGAAGVLGPGLGANQTTSSFAPLMGPQATLTLYKRVFVSAQFLNAGFNFHESGTSGGINSVGRSDTTFTAGVRVWEGLGVFVGHYTMMQRFQNASYQIKGPLVGLFGSQPISNSGVSLYGNVAMGWMTFHQYQHQESLSTDTAQAYSGETGVNLRGPKLWKIGTSLQLGYRYQIINQVYGQSRLAGSGGASSTRANDVTHGPTFMISAIF